MDDSNGDFEIVDKKMASVTLQSQADSTPGVSLLANIPPPSALPSFITSGAPLPNTVASLQPNVTPVPQPPNTTSPTSIPSNQSAAMSVPVKPATTGPVTVQPLPPASSGITPENSGSSSPVGFTTPSKGMEEVVLTPPEGGDFSDPEGYGWMGWIKGTVQNVSHKVAEKAKSSMDTMITALDPQMKGFINSGGDIDIIVASDKEVKINPVKEAFQKTFGKATVSGFGSQADGVAAQPVGFEAALASAEERINNLRASGKIHPQHPVVAVENFIVQLVEDYWVEMSLLLLDDPWHDVILQTYTQPLPLPNSFIEELKSATPDDYALKSSGFSTTIGQVASKHLQVHHSMWQERMTGVTRREFILMSAKVLAELYRSKLPDDVI